MDPNNDISSIATCTSCTFSEDFSNYWTAVLYFRARNGTFKRVPVEVRGLRPIFNTFKGFFSITFCSCKGNRTGRKWAS